MDNGTILPPNHSTPALLIINHYLGNPSFSSPAIGKALWSLTSVPHKGRGLSWKHQKNEEPGSGTPSSHLKLSGTSTRAQDATGRRETSFCKTVRPLPSTHPIFPLRNTARWAEDSHTSTPCSVVFGTVYMKRQPSYEKQGHSNAEHWFAPTWSGSCGFKNVHNMATRLQPPNADHQDVLSSVCRPLPHSDQPEDGRWWHGHGWGLLALLGGPSWNTFLPSTPVKVPLNLHGPCTASLMPCCKLKPLSRLPGVAPSPPSVLLCPVPSCAFALCRHAQDGLAGSKP